MVVVDAGVPDLLVMSWAAQTAIATVFCGCQINVATLEAIVSDDTGKNFGFTLTFLQFLFIVVVSLPEAIDWRSVRRGRPTLVRRQLRAVMIGALALMFWLVSVINNVVFIFDVSMPIHTLFRSSSMVVNVVTGYLFFQQRYSASQVACALLVTAGLAILTVFSPSEAVAETSSNVAPLPAAEGDGPLAQRLPTASSVVGIAFLLLSAILSACLGLAQDRAYAEARHANRSGGEGLPRWKEAMLYSHLLSIPLFLLTGHQQIISGLRELPASLYPFVALNVVSQYVCVRGVYLLTDTTSAFTMTLTITLRKFVSLLISIFYFGHFRNFLPVHWAAIAMVMLGGPLFPVMKQPPKNAATREASEPQQQLKEKTQ